MNEIQLLSAAWYGDKPLLISFPDDWEVNVVEGIHQPALTDAQIRGRIEEPLGTARLSLLAARAKSAAILVDDLGRPTPVAAILPIVVDQLISGGLHREAITVIVASGAHWRPSAEEMAVKVGKSLFRDLRVVAHSCQHDLVFLGKTDAGTPLHLSKHLMACDLKIGIGGIYPHFSAGFSGGGKILAPGACGLKTIQYLHKRFPGVGVFGGSVDSPFRREVQAISDRIGLDFVVNVVLNRERRVSAVFAGQSSAAYLQAVDHAKANCTVCHLNEADIVVADAYPFDTVMFFALHRGSTPFWHNSLKGTPVLLAACPQGLGHHQLFPLVRPLWRRVLGRLRRLRPRDLSRLLRRIYGAQREVANPAHRNTLVLSSGISTSDFSRALPKAELFRDWAPLLQALQASHPGPGVKVAVHRCAPLHVLE